MKKYVLSIFVFIAIFFSVTSSVVRAADPSVVTTLQATDALPQEGAWITDPTVTTIGKNAARSGMLLDWTLKDYKWASDSAYTNNPLVPLWLVIQRIVYALFLFVILVTAFILIVTRGRSLTAKRFLPRFFLVVLLVTFSFSLVQFLYQIIDIFQGFFLKNPSGGIISSRDLLYVGFDYKSFVGLRVFGQTYDESAFISLLLVKLTAFTYYAMVILLIFRKIILWFLIIVSPVFPLLLLFYPLRNTAKIWVGEFFRWLLYAPLFAIFLSGLVRLWHSGLPLIFNFTGVGSDASTVYPTAVNILLGGPGQNIGLHNSVNLPDTFALYLVALLMLWTVIILPFILLQIFLDYMMSFNYQNNPFIKQVYSLLNNRPILPISPVSPTSPPPATTGLARSLPFAKRFEMPKTTGLAKQIPTTANRTVERPTLVTRNNQTEISRLTNLSIPTMRDIARFETIKLSKDVMTQREVERMKQTLVNIANPASVSTSTERDRFRMIRERLVTEGQKGNSVASTVLNAATTYNTYNTQSSLSTISQQTQQLIQHLASPTTIISKRDQQKIVEIKQELTKAAKEGNQFASTVLNSVNSYTTNQVTQLQQLLQGIAHPEKVASVQEKEVYTSLREKIMTASKSGNPLASLVVQSLEGSTSQEQVKKIQDQLIEAKAQGNPLAAELLKTVSTSDKTTEKDMEKLHVTLQEASRKGDPLATLLLKSLASEQKSQTAPVSATAKLKAGTLPQVNRIQQVSLDDYEAVKKMWKDNYKNVEVPQGTTGQQSRKEWISEDIASIQETVSLLSSSNPQDVEKGMQQVSDILPFLLIGGFSQTEIIAYLKAKMEAGKNVLEEVGSQTEEEDTLLDTKRTTKTAVNHLAASAEIHDDADASNLSSTNVIHNTTNNYSTITNNQTTENVSVVEPVENTPIDTRLLERTQLTLPTLKEIAQFDTKAVEKSTSEISTIINVLHQIAHPEKIVNTEEKDHYTQLKEEIVKESQNNNPLAVMILNATESIESLPDELTADQTSVFSQTIQNILTPTVITESTNSDNYKEVNTLLTQQTKLNDPVAALVIKVSTELQTQNYEQAKDFFEKLSNPSSLATASEQMHYNKLVERIAQASEDGNPTARLILKTVREPISKESITNLITVLNSNSVKGDTLATYIHDSITSVPDTYTGPITALYKQVKSAKNQNNPLAISLLKLFTKELHPATKGIKSVTLPAKNRLQQVSVDDFETVKKLWLDNYQTAQAPEGMTRQAWIEQEGKDIQETINLLSSPDQEQVQAGMDKVGDILPFLLLGGFSRDEITGYLKAKLEAGKAAIATFRDDESKVEIKNTTQAIPQVHTLEAQEPVPTRNATPTSPQKVKVTFTPTLLDIASFETHTDGQTPLHEIAGVLLKLRNGQELSPDESSRLALVRQSLQESATHTDTSVSDFLSLLATPLPVSYVDMPEVITSTLLGVLDPSLVSDTATQPDYRVARDELVKARQAGDVSAGTIMKLADKVSYEQNERVMKFLHYLDNPQTLTDAKLKESYIALKQNLEKERATSALANTLLSLSQGEITSVSANKARVLLLENSGQSERAVHIMQQFISLSPTTKNEITNLYQQLEKRNDPFAKIVVKLINDRKREHQHQVKPLRLPKQNTLQKVALDDYEAIKKMFYERFINGDVPKTIDGKDQSRVEWITQEKNETERVINLLSSDIEDNVAQGMKLVGDILPFFLLGGFTHAEVLSYLKAKYEAAIMALNTLTAKTDSEDFLPSVRTNRTVASQQAEATIDEKK